MADPHTTELTRLHATAAESRLRVIESQLSLGFTLCTVADTEIDYSQFGEARKAIEQVKHAAEFIRTHVEEPNHVPESSRSALRARFLQLETRVKTVESRLRASIRHPADRHDGLPS